VVIFLTAALPLVPQYRIQAPYPYYRILIILYTARNIAIYSDVYGTVPGSTQPVFGTVARILNNGKASPTNYETPRIWNPRPVIDLVKIYVPVLILYYILHRGPLVLGVSVTVESFRLFLGHRKQKYFPPRDLVDTNTKHKAQRGRTWINVTDISVTFIRVGPQGYFTHIPITTPVVSALKNCYV
jgi:hypothetical protein